MKKNPTPDSRAIETKEPACPYCSGKLEYYPDQDDSVAIVCQECSYTARVPSTEEVRRVCRHAGRAVGEQPMVLVFIKEGTVISVAGRGNVQVAICDFDMGDVVGAPTVDGLPCDIRVWDRLERVDKTLQEVLKRIEAGKATHVVV